MFVAVRVRIDDALHTFALRVGPEPPVQIEAARVAIQFDPRAGFAARVNHGLLVTG